MLSRAGRRSVKKVLITECVAGSLWRNGIARWTSNPEAPGSSPGRDVITKCAAFWMRGEGAME